MNVVFENQHYVIVDKPSAMLSVPSRFEENDPRPVVGRNLSVQLGCQIFPVHRLDFEVSGLLLFAKEVKAHQAANDWFSKRQVKKTYHAITQEHPDYKVGESYEWKCRVLRGKKRTYEHELGKPSLTLAYLQSQFEEQGRKFFSWKLKPVTGRPHQLRFDCYRMQVPIVGDQLYGSIFSFAEKEILLRAVELQFPSIASEWGLPPQVAVTKLPLQTILLRMSGNKK